MNTKSEIKLSTCLIVRDAIKTFPNLIDKLLLFSDEIIINDTGSVDGTLEYVKSLTDPRIHLIENEWQQDFAFARNQSFKPATGDWIFWCDADDTIDDQFIETIKTLKKELVPSGWNLVMMQYDFGQNTLVPNVRLVKRLPETHWEGRCHEYIVLGSVEPAVLDRTAEEYGKIHHLREKPHTERNLDIFIHELCDVTYQLNLRDFMYIANESRDFGFFDNAYETYMYILPLLSGFELYSSLLSMFVIAEQKSEKYTIKTLLSEMQELQTRHDNLKYENLRSDILSYFVIFNLQSGTLESKQEAIKILEIAKKRFELDKSLPSTEKFLFDEARTATLLNDAVKLLNNSN